MPFYNEGAVIVNNIRRVFQVVSEGGFDPEVIAVNDGSTDHGASLIQEAFAGDANVHLVHCARNHGKGAAFRYGYEYATGEYIGLLDADLDISPTYMVRFAEQLDLQEVDAVIGSKLSKQSQGLASAVRLLYSWGYYCVVRALFHLPVRDTQTGAKLFRKQALQRVMPLLSIRGFSFDIELLVLLHQSGAKIQAYPVAFQYSQKQGNNFRLPIVQKMFLDTIKVWWQLRMHYYRQVVALERPCVAVVSAEESTYLLYPCIQTYALHTPVSQIQEDIVLFVPRGFNIDEFFLLDTYPLWVDASVQGVSVCPHRTRRKAHVLQEPYPHTAIAIKKALLDSKSLFEEQVSKLPQLLSHAQGKLIGFPIKDGSDPSLH